MLNKPAEWCFLKGIIILAIIMALGEKIFQRVEIFNAWVVKDRNELID